MAAARLSLLMAKSTVDTKLAQEIARRVRGEREASGISQEELGRRAKIHRTYIGAVERAEKRVTVATLYRIARALRCPITKFLPEVE